MKFHAAGLFLLVGAVALADDVTPSKAAQVTRDRQKAMEEVAKKYGNKKPSELSGDERRQMILDQAEAEKKAYEKNGVEAKDMARFEATASKEDRAAAKESGAQADKKEADAKKAAEAKKAGDAKAAGSVTEENGIIVERNTGEKAPAKGGKGKK